MRREPSRHLPPDRGPGALGWILLVLIVFPVLPIMFLFSLPRRRRNLRIAASRAGESICTFARGFGREIDTWIVRALYEELSAVSSIPPRASDDFSEVFGIEGEYLDDLAELAAERAGYSMEHAAAHRLYGHVRTVENLAVLMNDLPCRRPAA